MNLPKKTILALGLVVAGASFAQTAQNTDISVLPVGVLGQSYSETHVGVSDIKNFAKNQYSVGVAANLPVAPHLDLGGGYDYGWIRGIGHFNALGGTATAYTTYNGVKPFVGAGLGYQWTHVAGMNDDDWVWGAAIGVEIPVGSFSITPQIVYSDDFRSTAQSSQQTSYAVEGNYWFNKTSAVFGSVGYSDIHGTSNDSWDYSVGLRVKF